MPNYGKFLKELVSSKHNIEQISATFLSDKSSAILQNKVPPKLRDPGCFLIPCNFNKAFSCNALADLAENMLVKVGKFTFPADFVILEMEEDSKVPLILGRPFLHTADAVIRVKQKQLNLGVGTERMIFHIVKEGIVLGHKVSKAGLEVDKAKIDVISKLPPPLISKFLKKYTPFEFDDECHNTFKLLREKLTCALVIVSPNWNLPFQFMCDASDFTVGAILGQKDGKNFHPIYFASKTLNAAQQNYTITEKELMVVVFAFDKFRSYLVLSKTIVHTDHSALRHLFKKQDAKPRGYYFYKNLISKLKTEKE
ncbi:reverse transcriptase domain-containing protein [Tanacetum coccineum]|uniref:Reverse transcriptase domain-containing protein n=1 Tax=Tanacetum coccineum TaxID=301880 RepID=A0ABQ5AK58_9ASTR